MVRSQTKLSGPAARTFETTQEKILANPHTKIRTVRKSFLRTRGREAKTAWAIVAENIKELAACAHPSSEDLAEGFTLSRFLTLLEEDVGLAVVLCRNTPKKLDNAVQEVTRLDSMNQMVKKSKSVNPVQAGDVTSVIAVNMQQVLNGISELKISQEENVSSFKGKLNEHEERLCCLEGCQISSR